MSASNKQVASVDTYKDKETNERVERVENMSINGVAPINAQELKEHAISGEYSVIPGKPFTPGVSGNPAGRPKGTRNKLSEVFLDDLKSVWEETIIDKETGISTKTGMQAIREVAHRQPAKLLAAMCAVLPKDFQVSVTDESEGKWVINAQPMGVEEWAKKAQEGAE